MPYWVDIKVVTWMHESWPQVLCSWLVCKLMSVVLIMIDALQKSLLLLLLLSHIQVSMLAWGIPVAFLWFSLGQSFDASRRWLSARWKLLEVKCCCFLNENNEWRFLKTNKWKSLPLWLPAIVHFGSSFLTVSFGAIFVHLETCLGFLGYTLHFVSCQHFESTHIYMCMFFQLWCCKYIHPTFNMLPCCCFLANFTDFTFATFWYVCVCVYGICLCVCMVCACVCSYGVCFVCVCVHASVCVGVCAHCMCLHVCVAAVEYHRN